MQAGIDCCRRRVRSLLPLRKRHIATIDIDPTIKRVYGQCKDGADFSYEKSWRYRPLVVALEERNELLRVVIEQLKNELGALRMPTGSSKANEAFMLVGELACCLESWD